MLEAASSSQLPDEFDEVTSEIKYPQITKDTKAEDFVAKAGNGYVTWVVAFSVAGCGGFTLFIWALYELTKWL